MSLVVVEKRKSKRKKKGKKVVDYWILENPTNSKLAKGMGWGYSLDYLPVGPCFVDIFN